MDSASGQVVDSYRYTPFGKVLTGSSSDNTQGFTGESYDPTTGLIYRSAECSRQSLRARYYDPALGRFLTQDPFPGFAATPGTQHPYAYVGSNPVNWVDPSGHFFGIPGILIGGFVGGVAGAGSYALSVAASGGEFDAWDMGVVALTGMTAGAMIGSGVNVLALVGTGGASSGLGYLASNVLGRTQFCRKDFNIAVSVGGVASLLSMGASSVWAHVALGASSNVAQYWLMTYTSGRNPTKSGTFWSAVAGGAAGAIGHKLEMRATPPATTGPPIAAFRPGNLPGAGWFSEALANLPPIDPPSVAREAIKGLLISFVADMIGNSPDLVP